jgi:aspartyl-tRNA synthetase
MKILEELVSECISGLVKSCPEELATLGRKIEPINLPFRRITYNQLIEELKSEGIDIEWGQDLELQHLKAMGKKLESYYFITDWPTKLKPFYIRPSRRDASVSESFDLQYSWLELASGGTRIHEEELLLKRLKEQGLNPQNFKDHLQAFEVGMPPHSGWAVGLARLMMVITGVDNIRECVFYPRDRIRLTP